MNIYEQSNMIKSVVMVLDTDSNIVSLDAWYRFVSEKISGEEFNIASYEVPYAFFAQPQDMQDAEWDKMNARWKDESTSKSEIMCPIRFVEGSKYDYDFETDEIVELDHYNRPDIINVNDNMRYSIMNILAYVLDIVVNEYMAEVCRNNHSVFKDPEDPSKEYRKCRIIAKNEFTFNRLMMTTVKKNYASLQSVQEGNMVPVDKQLDTKGIEVLTKSSKSEYTRNALKKILLEDIMRAPVIDQLKFVKDMAILEKTIVNSIQNGEKKFFKPMVVKAMNVYSDPIRQQGIKASIVYNTMKPNDGTPSLNLEERNAVDIAKVQINHATIEKIKDTFPEVYENCLKLLEMPEFKGKDIDAVALPIDVITPDWLLPFIDYDELVSTNLGGFPYESIGLKRFEKNSINYTNIVQL